MTKKKKKKRYKCMFCGKIFDTAQKLADHILHKHMTGDPAGKPKEDRSANDRSTKSH